MGVSGLTSFIDNNLQLIEAYKLCNTKLIIDGNNLFHLIFYDHSIDFKHGGDYDHFHRCCNKFFDMLERCGVVPFVVFDGAYHADDRKLQTLLKRARQRIETAAVYNRHAPWRTPRVMPVLAFSAFVHALQERGMAHCVCDEEADDQIAVLSNQWACPVLSYDSDFYVYDMQGGFIPFDGVQLRICSSEDDPTIKFIPATIYFAKNIYKHFPQLGPSVLPLMATLMGNDYVNADKEFEAFLAQLKKPKHAQIPFSVPSANTKLKAIIHWLSGLPSVAEAVRRILATVKSSMEAKVRDTINISLNMYSNVKEFRSLNLQKFFEGSRNIKELYPGQLMLPSWFLLSFWEGKIFPFCLNTVFLHRNLNLCTMECLKEMSVYECSINIRKVIYGILLADKHRSKNNKPSNLTDSDGTVMNKLEVETCDSKEKNEDEIVVEYSRDGRNVKKFLVSPTKTLKDFGAVPSLEEVGVMTMEEKKHLVLSVVNRSNNILSDVPDKYQLVILAIHNWLQHSDPRVTLNEIKAIIVCMLTMDVLNTTQQSPVDEKDTKGDNQNIISQNFSKFFRVFDHSKKHQFDIREVHNFSQFQVTYLALMTLNQVLQFPLVEHSPSQFFNGMFLYRFVHELDVRSETDDYVTSLLGKHSELSHLYLKCIQEVVAIATLEGISLGPIKFDKSKRKKKKSKLASTGKILPITTDLVSSDSADNEEDIRRTELYDENNRFGILSLH